MTGRRQPVSDRDRRARRQAGFTLVELMVSLTIGALLVAAIVSLGGASSRHFQEQQRIGVTQRAVRMAMQRLRRDFSRAGYLSVPSDQAPGVITCTSPAPPRPVPAVQFSESDPEGDAALDTINRSANDVTVDRVRMIGAYDVGDPLLVRGTSSTGDQLVLQTNWMAFRRNFVRTVGGSPQVDVAHYNQVFRPGRMLHIEDPTTGNHIFSDIIGRSVSTAGLQPTVSISPSLGADNPCVSGTGRGMVVAPLTQIEYGIFLPDAGSSLNPSAAAVVGGNTVLMRREIDMTTNTVVDGSEQVVLEYAVNFELDWIVDTNLTPGNPPVLQLIRGEAAEPVINNSTWTVRSVIVRLAARTPEQDPRFPWPDSWAGGRPAGAPFNRYQVFPGRPGAARVRTMTTEIQMPNLLPRNN